MATYTIENEKLSVTIAAHGAELSSIYDKENDRELVWQADPAFWNRHAPVLFPNVGKYYGGYFTYNGKEYPIASLPENLMSIIQAGGLVKAMRKLNGLD